MVSIQELEVQKPRVTEIQVRIDCNGCVQKIKKALYGVHGIYDICIDLPQQKLTIIGWADPEQLVKAIKKSRRTATICPDPNQAAQPPEQSTEGGPPPPEAARPSEPPPPEASPAAEPPKDPPQADNPQPPKPENPQGEANLCSETKEVVFPNFGQKDGDVFIISRPNNYSHRRPWFGQPIELPVPFHMTHTYTPAPYVTEFFESPAKPTNYYAYGGPTGLDRHYNSKSFSRVSQNIASVFSDENPHACGIM